MTYSAAFAALFASKERRMAPVLDLGFPGGTARLCGTGGVSSDLNGNYVGRVEQWGQIHTPASGLGSSLPAVETTVLVPDADGWFKTLAANDSLKGSAATIRLASLSAPGVPGLAYAEWPVFFDGILKGWNKPSPRVYELILRFRDAALKSKVPKTKIMKQDWPNAKPDVYAQAAPVVMGVHDSSGSTSKGLVPTLYLDTVGFRYGISYARLKSVPRVFADGVLVSTGQYSITFPLVNGRQWTLVDFTSDRGESVITVDASGIETVGDGTGTVITEPAALLAWALANLGYSDYQSGLWLPDTTAPIDVTSFGITSAYSVTNAFQASKYLQGEKLEDLIAQFCQSFGWKVYWTLDGKIGVMPVRTVLPADSRRHIKFTDFSGAPAFSSNQDQFVSRVSVKYNLDAATDAYLSSLDVGNPRFDVDDEVAFDLSLPCGAASVVAT